MNKIVVLMVALFSSAAHAHVKWFSDYNFGLPPLQLSDLNTPVFWGLFALSVVSMPIMVYLDHLADKSALYHRANAFLDRYAENGPLIMRVAMGAVLLMSWQGDSIIAPELPITSPIWGWLELLLALFLLFRETTFIAGMGVIFFWIMGIGQFGLFHMLDYIIYPAVGVYLVLSYSKYERMKNLDLPILYSGLGFSLCWVAFEKLLYPSWGLSVLAKAPALTMGLDPQFFLMACAFVEFSLGYLLIICLLHRPLAAVITLVFFTTTSFFGKTEVVGHTILHGALLVFIVKGPGHYYRAPIRFHKSPVMQSLFAAINFIVLFAILIFPYQKLANQQYEKSAAMEAAVPKIEVTDPETMPSIMIHASKDSLGGWNFHLMTKNFKFTPQNANQEDVPNEGHAHLYVNGIKVSRVYGEWVHLNLPKGKNKIKATLNSNQHKDYYFRGKPIGFEIEIDEERTTKQQHMH